MACPALMPLTESGVDASMAAGETESLSLVPRPFALLCFALQALRRCDVFSIGSPVRAFGSGSAPTVKRLPICLVQQESPRHGLRPCFFGLGRCSALLCSETNTHNGLELSS